MYTIEGLAGSAGQAVAMDATSQLMRSCVLPFMLIGPSETMFPPRNVRLLFICTPVVPQSMYQFPLGTVRSPEGVHEYVEVHRVNPVGTPVPPYAATRLAMAGVPAVGQPVLTEQL